MAVGHQRAGEREARPLRFEFCPGFWEWLDVAWAAGQVASVEAVYDELVDYGDQLSGWARDHRAFFLSLGPDEVQAMATVNGWAVASRNYTLAAKQEFAEAADSALIAFALFRWPHRRDVGRQAANEAIVIWLSHPPCTFLRRSRFVVSEGELS